MAPSLLSSIFSRARSCPCSLVAIYLKEIEPYNNQQAEIGVTTKKQTEAGADIE
jgi:hypothetical protein